jgi:hypothetical protein
MHGDGSMLIFTGDDKPCLLLPSAAGKRVVVVGAGRSALDCAGMMAASNIATSVTWLFRQVSTGHRYWCWFHWPACHVLCFIMQWLNCEVADLLSG